MTQMDAVDWLMGSDSDPAIRWQAQRDLLDEPEAVWSAERAKVETEGWGARLLGVQDPDGQWAGGAFFPADFSDADFEREGQPWTATSWSLNQLRDFGLEPHSASAVRTVELVGSTSTWEHDNQPFWQGEVEECINGRTIAFGAYFGVDVTAIVDQVLANQMADGGWNCERENGSVRGSFDSTINVLEGLLEFERATGGTAESTAARHAGEQYLLHRHLVHRATTGAIVDDDYLLPGYPTIWRYDILRALDYFRSAGLFDGTPPDARLDDAVAALRSRQRDDGRWNLDRRPRGRVWFDVDDGVGEPSRWVTLHALRVLRWVDAEVSQRMGQGHGLTIEP